MNIFHTLAENALAGMYTPESPHHITTAMNYEAGAYWHIAECFGASDASLYLVEPEIQCLFFLFCGEMYNG